MTDLLAPELQAAVDAVRADPEQWAEHLAGEVPLAARQAAVEQTIAALAARVAPEIADAVADRLRRILLHPAANAHWLEAMELLGSNLDVGKAVAALEAIAGSGGGKIAN